MENTKLIDELYKASKAGIVGIDSIKDEVEAIQGYNVIIANLG